MNKELVKKIVKAGRLKHEIIMEILPESLRTRAEAFEKDAFDLLKDISIEMMQEDVSEENHESKKTTKKVNVDFS